MKPELQFRFQMSGEFITGRQLLIPPMFTPQCLPQCCPAILFCAASLGRRSRTEDFETCVSGAAKTIMRLTNNARFWQNSTPQPKNPVDAENSTSQ